MAIDESGLSGQALKNAQAYNRAMDKAAKSLEQQKKSFDEISSTLLGIDGGAFFRDLTNDELKAKTEELEAKMRDLQVSSAELGNEMQAGFEAITKGAESAEELADKLGLNAVEAKVLADNWNDGNVNFAQLTKEMDIFGDSFVEKIVNSDLDENLVTPFADAVEQSQELDVELEKAKDALKNMEKTTFSLASGMSAVGNNIAKSFSLKNLTKEALNFNQTIKDAQVNTGIAFDQNTTAMGNLASETAKYGMSLGETTDLMGKLSNTLRTTNFGVLSEAAEDLAAMGKATGLNADEMANLAKEYVKFGGTTKQMSEDAAATMNDARVYGVSGVEVMQEMAKNMSKMRQMGFTGGEASLRRMVLESKRLGMNVDEIFETGKRARNIEGAMEMAAELQLAGGSFAAIDPMQLLSAARKGPEELQKLLGQMGKDIGSFNEETGQYEFDPVDIDRLQMVSDATGQSMDSLQNMISQNAQDNQKMEMLPPGLFGANLTDEQKAFIMQATSMKDGKLTVNAGVEGLDDFANMNQEQIQAVIDEEKKKKETLEEQAAQNQSLMDSITALKNSFINLLVPFLQPIIEALTGFVQWLIQMPNSLKIVIGGLLAAMAILFGPAKAFINGIAQAKGFQAGMQGGNFLKSIKTGLGGIFKGGGAAAGGTQQMMGPKPPQAPAGGGGQGWIASMAAGIKAFGQVKMKDILKLGFALTVIGGAVALFMAGIAATGSPDGAQLAAAAASMVIMAGGLWLATKILGNMSMKDVIMGALAMGIMGLALIPFAFAAQMMGDVDWLNVLAGVGIAILVVALLTLLGVGMMFAMPFLLLGAGALAIAGIALLIGAVTMAAAGQLLMTALEPLGAIAEADWSGLVSFAAAMGEFGIGLIWSGISLLAGAYFLFLAAPMMAIAAPLLVGLTSADWSGLTDLAAGLGVLGPALLSFAVAGLAFFNPFVLLGVGLMLGAISQLKGDMGSLAPNLQLGADGLERMAAGVGQLEAAVANMNMEKLQQLAEIMAEGGAEMGKFVAEINKAEDRKVTHVVQLQIDGKDLQEIILKDNKHTT